MTKPIGLLPCPFCGSTDVAIERFAKKWYVICLNGCQSSGANWSRKDRAIDQWNTRVTK